MHFNASIFVVPTVFFNIIDLKSTYMTSNAINARSR